MNPSAVSSTSDVRFNDVYPHLAFAHINKRGLREPGQRAPRTVHHSLRGRGPISPAQWIMECDSWVTADDQKK